MEILDSGNRRQFDTGAVRDISDDKGRCDLLPLDVVAEHLGNVITYVSNFVNSGDPSHLHRALDHFASKHYDGSASMMFLEVAKHFEEGAKKYGEYNWQMGIPVRCYVDSAIRHYLKFRDGYDDEPHDRAFVWNIMCCIWTCKHKPELNNYKKEEE